MERLVLAVRLTERIQSRKFLLALASCSWFAITAGPAGYGSITQIVVAYLAVQAAQDALTDWTASRATASAEQPAD